MEDMLGQILSDLNSLRETVREIDVRLKRLESSGQALVEIDSNFEENSRVEDKIADTSALESLDYIWRKALDIIKKEMTEVSFKTWLEIVVPLSMDKNIIRLGVPGEFEKGILECRYTSLIKTALKSITNIDFENFSFEINYNPQPSRLKLKAKKFTYFKLILSNDSENEVMTILNLTLPALTGGMSK
jgi:hypothetical protein